MPAKYKREENTKKKGRRAPCALLQPPPAPGASAGLAGPSSAPGASGRAAPRGLQAGGSQTPAPTHGRGFGARARSPGTMSRPPEAGAGPPPAPPRLPQSSPKILGFEPGLGRGRLGGSVPAAGSGGGPAAAFYLAPPWAGALGGLGGFGVGFFVVSSNKADLEHPLQRPALCESSLLRGCLHPPPHRHPHPPPQPHNLH